MDFIYKVSYLLDNNSTDILYIVASITVLVPAIMSFTIVYWELKILFKLKISETSFERLDDVLSFYGIWELVLKMNSLPVTANMLIVSYLNLSQPVGRAYLLIYGITLC